MLKTTVLYFLLHWTIALGSECKKCDLPNPVDTDLCNCGRRDFGTAENSLGSSSRQDLTISSLVLIVLHAYDIHCSGTIIDKRHVITTATCVQNLIPQDIHLVARNGMKLVFDGIDKEGVYKCQEIKTHKQFNPDTRDYNAAVLVTSEDMIFNNFAGPACLPYKMFSYDMFRTKVILISHEIKCNRPLNDQLYSDKNFTIVQELDVETNQYLTEADKMSLVKDQKCNSLEGSPIFTPDRTGKMYLLGFTGPYISWDEPKKRRHIKIVAMLRWIKKTTGAVYCEL